MGQCVSRNSMAPYASVHPCYDPDFHHSIYSISPSPVCPKCHYNVGQSDSKGARKRSTTPASKGSSMSFGFKKKGHKDNSGSSISREVGNPAIRLAASDRNGNGGSKEELFTGSPVLSGRSTPLARPRKDNSVQPLRTNRFGFRQTTIPKTAKVADVNISAEQAFNSNLQEQESKNNNSFKDNQSSNLTSPGLIPMQIGPNGMSIFNTQQPIKPVTTKQTIILTYSAKQYTTSNQGGNIRSKSPAIPNRATTNTTASPRSASASRAYSSTGLGYDAGNYRTGNYNNKYSFQTNQLPRVQYPSIKLLESKFDKQVANNSKKGNSSSSDASSKEGSTTGDSGVGGEPNDRQAWSPHSSRRLRRPRTLEMVMRGEHTFHLRELQVSDLDIMDEAVVTDVDVIPLPKLPSNFDKEKNTDGDYPPFNRFSSLLGSATEQSLGSNQQSMSFAERYRTSRDRNRLPSLDNESDHNEEKASKDRLQCEKDFAKMSTSSQFASSLTRNSSKESSPSTNEDSHPSAGSEQEVWVNQNAGESMALRSNDDISAALSLSLSCDEDRSTKVPPVIPSFPSQPLTNNFFPQTRIEIVNSTEPSSAIRDYAKLSQHPLMMNSFTLSQASPLQSMFMSTSMTSSAFSAGSDSQQFNLLAQDPQAALAALAGSNQSMIDDETSPADSLISSSSESNNELPLLEKDTTVSSSAYHTADNKTGDNNCQEEKEVCEESIVKENTSIEKSPSEKQSPRTPGTPSNSLSLSEGRDFLIDDEIADQPALIFESNSTAEQMTSSLQLLNLNNATDNTATLQDQNDSPLINKKNKGLQNSQKVQSSPSCIRRNNVPPARSPSLDTLSPCDSIASDDLICDMDLNNSLTSLNSQDEYFDRLDGSIRSGLNSLEDAQLREELMRYSIKRQQCHPQSNGDLGSHHSTPLKHQTPSTSNSSITNIGAALPARTARLLGRSRASTPEAVVKPRPPQSTPPGPPHPDDNGSLRLERSTHGSMQQDIVSIKAMLLKLKRVLQEPDEGLNMMRTETLNPLDIQGSPLKYGPSLHLGEEGEASPPPPPPAPHEEVADLKRQLVFLQSQLEERERMVKLLQQQMNKYSDTNSPNSEHKCNGEDMCNVATQTERLRPLSQGPNILQALNSDTHTGGLVSWNEQITPRKLSASPNDCNSNSVTTSQNTTATSRLRKPNSIPTASNDNNQNINKNKQNNGVTDNNVQLKVNCRVGSRYLQAISNRKHNNDLVSNNKSDTSFCQKTVRSRSLHASRSKSIENLHNTKVTNGCNNNNNISNGLKVFNGNNKTNNSLELADKTVQNGKKHHTSCSNLSSNSDNCQSNCCPNGKLENGLNNDLTDTDENSDSGYKSLPPSINLINGNNNKGTIVVNNNGSAIPRRSHNGMDFRLSTSKEAQTNKC